MVVKNDILVPLVREVTIALQASITATDCGKTDYEIVYRPAVGGIVIEFRQVRSSSLDGAKPSLMKQV